MNQDSNQEQVPDHAPPSKWLKLFLTVNLVGLIGLFVWEVMGPLSSSDEHLADIHKRQAEFVAKAIEKNLPPKDLSGTLSGEIKYSLDATTQANWVHFSFSKGTFFAQETIAKDSLDWDIAFRRAKMITNGGDTNPKGKTEVAATNTSDFDSVTSAKIENKFYADVATDNPFEPKNPILDKWYIYDFWTHRLTVKPVIYVFRTVEGHWVKMQILDYYCGTAAGCFTFRYVFQGSGSFSFKG